MTQQEVAIKAMKELGIFTPYIEAFKKDGIVTCFESCIGWHIGDDNYPELKAKIKEFEERTGSLVYAVTHENTEFGECYDLLCVSKYEEDWGDEVIDNGGYSIVFAYVWNATFESDSEFGSIGVASRYGGVCRVA